MPETEFCENSSSHDAAVRAKQKKLKKTQFDLKLPDFVRVDWKKPECSCKGDCNCDSFKYRMTATSTEKPKDRAIDTKSDDGVDWSKILNIDLLNISWRQAIMADLPFILKLVNDDVRRLFDVDEAVVKLQIEHAMCFFVALNFQEKIVGAICVDDIPSRHSVIPNYGWDSCIPHKFSSYNIQRHTTLWVHFMVFAKRYKHAVHHRLITPVFQLFHFVTRLVIFLRPQTILTKFWACIFESAKTGGPDSRSSESDLDDVDLKMYFIDRKKYIQPLILKDLDLADEEGVLRVYKSLENDHKMLRKKYGENYIEKLSSEKFRHILLGVHPAKNREHSVFVLATNFDLDTLKEKYEVHAFHNFKQNSSVDYLQQPEKRYVSALSQDMMAEVSDIMDGEDIKRSRETEEKEEGDEKEDKDDEEGEMTVIEGLTWTNFLMAGTQDSDEEEGRGMDKIISTDNPIDKITYKNLCMTMSNTNLLKDLKSNTARKTPTATLSFEVEGSLNAVVLDYFHMSSQPPFEEIKRYILMIFEKLPTVDYIIFKSPRKTSFPDIYKYLLKVPPKGYKAWPYYDEELHVLHKWSFSGVVEIRPIAKSDIQRLMQVIGMENNPDELIQELMSSAFEKNSRNSSFVFTVNKKIVGAAVVCPEREVDYYKFHYDLSAVMEESLHNRTEIGYIKHMVINGLHECRTREFVRQIMRVMSWTSVFFARYPTYHQEGISDYSLPSGLRHFVPVRPRRVPNYAVTLGSHVPPYHLLNSYPPFALYHLNLRNASLRKTYQYTKIVVVGTGETGLSFLENLFFSVNSVTDLFVDVVVITKHQSPFAYPRKQKVTSRKKSSSVSHNEDIRLTWLHNLKHGIDKIKRNSLKDAPRYRFFRQQPALSDQRSSQRSEETSETTFKTLAEKMIVRRGQYTSSYLAKLGLETWVTVVEGSMTGIHREEKCVEVDRRKMIPYDYLFLFCGKQFCSPQADRRNIVSGTECKALYDWRTPYFERVSLKPKNLFMINCMSDATAALRFIKRQSPGKGQILVYGSCPDCLSCIESLLQIGVTPSRIALIESDLRAPYAIDYFNDPVVYESIRRKLYAIGVSHYFYYNFVSWDYNETTQLISKAHFESQSRMCALKCIALFSYSPKEITYDTQIVYEDCNLVFDDGLIIDEDFSTNDKSIFAAGPGTRYKRKYFAQHYFHEHYNSTEVGAEIAARALRTILGKSAGNDLIVKQCIIDFKRPIVTSCAIAGELRYLQVRRPGPIVPLEVLINQLDFGSILVTGDVSQNFPSYEGAVERDYFKIILNENGLVIDITCLSSMPIDENNIINLYGQNEKALNNLSQRYKSHLILNLYEYFKEPWAYLFYHDKFEALIKEFRALIYKKMINFNNETFGDLIGMALRSSRWKLPTASSMSELFTIFQNSSDLLKTMGEKLSVFMNENSDHLPMLMNSELAQRIALEASRDDIYSQRKQGAGEKPLVNDPYTFDMHEDMPRLKKFYEKVE